MTEPRSFVARSVSGRTIRVFVSSTFRDMQRERDELAKYVFPVLRRRCAERGVTWGDVDLRWGIPDEQRGEVLATCLAEIDRCRPYFIGLLGERYGWVPEEIGSDLVEGQAWLREYSGRSVTELEIVKAVIGDAEMACHAFFYLRDPDYVDMIPADQQDALRELPAAEEIEQRGAQEAERRAGERRLRLSDLKDRIRGSGFPVHDGYPDPRALGELVLADLIAVIDRLFPAGSEPDPLEREAAEHEAFAASRARVYVGRDEYLARLDAHAAGDGPPLVVLGESGSGKSALIANWAVGYRASHPDETVIMHFVGSSPYSSDWRAMLRRIMGELGGRPGIEGEIPDAPEQLRLAFAQRLYAAAAQGRVILAIDALNQLEDRDGAADLVWVPPVLPANVRVVVSTLPGRPLAEVERRGWPTLRVQPLTVGERKTLIRRLLREYTKTLGPEHVDRIAAAPQSANPLYLRALLEELRLWGVHETLGRKIDTYLLADTIDALSGQILDRYEADYERERPGLVRDALSLIWAARRGLSEAELLDLLGSDGQPLPAAYWSPLSLAAEPSLTLRSGLIGFAHEYVRRAIESRYLQRGSDREAAHLRLADYFDPRRQDRRGIDELPWQLAEANAWQRLSDLLVDREFFERSWANNEFDVKTSWARVEASSTLRLADACRPLVEDTDPDPGWAFGLSKLLRDTGHLPEARTLLERFCEHCRARDDGAHLAAGLVNLAILVMDQGDLSVSMALLREQERIARELDDQLGLHRSLGNQATIRLVWGELDDATSLLRDQERICRQIDDRMGLATSLGNQAVILMRKGELDRALELHAEEERICRELGDPAALHRSLGNQATVLQLRGDLDGAQAQYRASECSCRQLGDRAGVQLALGNQATILVLKGELDAGMELLREQEKICREIGDRDGLHRTLGNRAVILQRRGELDAAMRLQKEKEEICRELGDPAGLHLALGNQGQILNAQGRPDAARVLLVEQERICRDLGDQAGLQDSLGNQAAILLGRGDLDAAMVLLCEQERICRGLGHQAGVATSLANQAHVLRERGQSVSAMELVECAERIFRELGDVLELSRSLVLKGFLLSDTGHEREAIACIGEAHRIASEHGLADLARETAEMLAAVEQARSGG